jgi:hypothetical protein
MIINKQSNIKINEVVVGSVLHSYSLTNIYTRNHRLRLGKTQAVPTPNKEICCLRFGHNLQAAVGNHHLASDISEA